MTERAGDSAGLPGREPDFSATDPYLVLGLPHSASQAEIKRTYFALIRQYPPESEPEKFKIIRTAYEKLRSARRRAETDIFLPYPPPPWAPPEDLPALDTSFYPADALRALRAWGDLGRSDFEEEFREIEL